MVTLILRLLERFGPGIPPFEEVESHVNETLYSQRMEPKLREFLTQLRKDSYISSRQDMLTPALKRRARR